MTHTAILPVSIGPLESVHRVRRDLCQEKEYRGCLGIGKYIHSYNTTQQETVNAVYAMMSHTISW